MMDRYIEDEIIGICRENGMGITAFSPLSQGLLTGKYRKDQPIPEGSRATWQGDRQINKLLTEENLDKVERLIKVADGPCLTRSILRKVLYSCRFPGDPRMRQAKPKPADGAGAVPDSPDREVLCAFSCTRKETFRHAAGKRG